MGHQAQPDAKLHVAGKTGTSLVEEGSWRHGWFAGYAPTEKPEIVLVVFVEKGHGPTDAASAQGDLCGVCKEPRGRSMRRITVLLVISLVVCAPGAQTQRAAPATGFPNTVRVRLGYMHPAVKLRITAEPGQAKYRKCAKCAESSLTALSLSAVGSQVQVEGTSSRARYASTGLSSSVPRAVRP